MAGRDQLLQSVVGIIADYREGEIVRPDAQHVDRWVRQFPEVAQQPILAELAHVFGKTYFSKADFRSFLGIVLTSSKLVGGDPCSFWRGVKFLNLQTAGNSQRDMLALFEEELKKLCGLALADCGANPHTYVYLDDALYSGGRIKQDLVAWINGDAPTEAQVAVITIAIHRLGEWFAGKDIMEAAKNAGKKVQLTWWNGVQVEDRKTYMANADVLRPKLIPADAAVQAYVAELGAPPVLRTGANVGPLGIYTSDAGRSLLEQEFLKAGVRIRQMCTHFNKYMRPLGCSLMKTTGFGSTIVTYRNCANNTPLAFWAGDPWYPLFARKIN